MVNTILFCSSALTGVRTSDWLDVPGDVLIHLLVCGSGNENVFDMEFSVESWERGSWIERHVERHPRGLFDSSSIAIHSIVRIADASRIRCRFEVGQNNLATSVIASWQ